MPPLPSDLDALRAILADALNPSRGAAAIRLGHLGDLASVPLLIPLLGDLEQGIAQSATDALCTLGGPIVARAIAPMLRDECIRVRNHAAQILTSVGRPSYPLLVTLARDEDDDVRLSALEILYHHAPPEVLDLAVDALADPNINIATAATRLIGAIGAPDSVPALQSAFGRSDWLTCAIATSLGQIATEDAVDALLQLFEHDAQGSVQFSAIKALTVAQDVRALPTLRRLSARSSPILKAAATRALFILQSRAESPSPPAASPHSIEDHVFLKLRLQIHHISGIWMGADKDYFLASRVISRMNALNFDTTREYLQHIEQDPHHVEIQTLLNAVTIGETYFFRDYKQLTVFGEEIIPQLVAADASNRTLRILCAGCATGEEAYTLAIIAREMLPESWSAQVTAFDINTNAIATSQHAVYGARSTREVPDLFRLLHFDPHGSQGDLHVKADIRALVDCEVGNLYDPAYMAQHVGFDVVFCRNVLIYFSDASRARALNILYHSLRPGGIIFLGYAESLTRYSAAFEPLRLDDLIVHRRPHSSQQESPISHHDHDTAHSDD